MPLSMYSVGRGPVFTAGVSTCTSTTAPIAGESTFSVRSVSDVRTVSTMRAEGAAGSADAIPPEAIDRDNAATKTVVEMRRRRMAILSGLSR